jgi:hypothetical protein
MGHPALFACVAALVVNDHVLKDRYPGWWTGKLSDFAGLAMLGIVLAAAIGPRRGLAVAGMAFALLQLVPGVAEAAAPLLGGATRRDPPDLLAVTVLVPIWLALRPRRLAGGESQPLESARPSASGRKFGRPWRRWLRSWGLCSLQLPRPRRAAGRNQLWSW